MGIAVLLVNQYQIKFMLGAAYPLERSLGILGFASRSTKMGCAFARSFPASNKCQLQEFTESDSPLPWFSTGALISLP